MLGSTEEGEEWRLMPRPLVIDSGAAETVLPTDWFTGHELKDGRKSPEEDSSTWVQEEEKSTTMAKEH